MKRVEYGKYLHYFSIATVKFPFYFYLWENSLGFVEIMRFDGTFFGFLSVWGMCSNSNGNKTGGKLYEINNDFLELI